jgi:lipoate-protein ligase B
MNVVDLGTKDYKLVWDMQKRIHEKRVLNEIDDTLLLVEHEPVITMGRSGKEKHLLRSRELLRKRGVAYYEIERGGDVTFHGPGQLVGYPILNIRHGLAGIRPYIEKLQDVIIATLGDFGLPARARDKMIGVWTEAGKICSIGVAVKRWVSFHGFALNVNTDLSFFDLIVPCGIKNVTMTSMKEILHTDIRMHDVKEKVKAHFSALLGKTLEERCSEEII